MGPNSVLLTVFLVVFFTSDSGLANGGRPLKLLGSWNSNPQLKFHGAVEAMVIVNNRAVQWSVSLSHCSQKNGSEQLPIPQQQISTPCGALLVARQPGQGPIFAAVFGDFDIFRNLDWSHKGSK